jgi:hypothetical protein
VLEIDIGLSRDMKGRKGRIAHITIFCRNWQDQRIACTENVIAFARVDESMLLDAIPLSEVMSIEVMMPVDQRSEQRDQPTNSFDAVIDFTNALQIRTVKNGQNAGRKYILRGSSDTEVATVVEKISELAKKAAKKEAANSWRESMQHKLRILYDSKGFQGVTAILIVAVCALPKFSNFLVS